MARIFPAFTKGSLDNELVWFCIKPRSGCHLLMKTFVGVSHESVLHLT